MSVLTTTYQQFYCTGLFLERATNGQVQACQVKQVQAGLAIGANQQIIALVSGKQIRVISGYINSNTAVLAQSFFLSNGVKLTANLDVAGNTQHIFPWDPFGHFDSTVSQNLAMTVAGAAIEVFLRYIEFTPIP